MVIAVIDIDAASAAARAQVSTQWCVQVRVSRGLAALASRRPTATCVDTSQWPTYAQVIALAVTKGLAAITQSLDLGPDFQDILL